MQKVLVIGCPGAGKSTFARALRDATGLPLCYLDMLWHKPDRTNVTPEAFDRALAEWLARPAWIIDGNYSRTLPTRLAVCDTVFFLDYPLNVCLAGVEGRIGQVREDMPWVETEWDPEFRQYILDFGRDQYPRMLCLLDRCRAERDVVTFHSRSALWIWLAVCIAVCAADYTPAELDAWAPPEGPDLAAWDASFQAHCTWIAEIGGRIAGFGDIDPASGYLDRLYVGRDFQRRGVGAALCDVLEAACPVRPVATHASRTARGFFEKRGYCLLRAQRVERRGQLLENFVMEKP